MTGKELYEQETKGNVEAMPFAQLSENSKAYWNYQAANHPGGKNPEDRLADVERFVAACRAMFKHMGLKLPELSEPPQASDEQLRARGGLRDTLMPR